MVLDPARDHEGLLNAFAEVLEEDFAQSRMRRSLEDAADESREHMVATLPRRTLSEGYYKLAEYLLWLEGLIAVGAPILQMAMLEADGLGVLKRARSNFERNHPECGSCGARQDTKFAVQCCGCGTQFRR